MTELSKIFEGRASIYEYLSLVFREPPQHSFIGISGNYARVAAAYAEDSGSDVILRGAKLLIEYSALEDAAQANTLLNELNSIYTSLFSLGFSSIAATESGFLSPGGMMKQEQWEAVCELYKKWEYKNSPSFNEPEDHISMELRFMEKLSLACASFAASNDGEKLRGTLEVQLHFLQNHMTKWVPFFCKAVVQRSANVGKYRLYESAALITSGFIENDVEFLKAIL